MAFKHLVFKLSCAETWGDKGSCHRQSKWSIKCSETLFVITTYRSTKPPNKQIKTTKNPTKTKATTSTQPNKNTKPHQNPTQNKQNQNSKRNQNNNTTTKQQFHEQRGRLQRVGYRCEVWTSVSSLWVWLSERQYEDKKEWESVQAGRWVWAGWLPLTLA